MVMYFYDMIFKNQVINRDENKSIIYDLYYNENQHKKPVVIFCHGYKGFKDWGAWHLVAKAFMDANCFFVKFNFSHNGGTTENPIDFPDLEAFAQNNYTKELEDLHAVTNTVLDKNTSFFEEMDINNVTLIGHSRGGGVASIFASEDLRIKKLITWASVSDFRNRFGTVEELKEWKATGVKTVLNGRTKQQIPHYYQFYEDFLANVKRLNIEQAVKCLKIPQLIIHARDDNAVKFKEALSLHEWNPKNELVGIENSNHVFGASHPWEKNNLPEKLQEVVCLSLEFIKT
jgi:pimeloyl-ACP methyl ester carboxylesterase